MCRVPIDPDPDPKRPRLNHRGTETHRAAQSHRGIAVDRHRVFEVAVFRTIDGGDRGDLTPGPGPALVPIEDVRSAPGREPHAELPGGLAATVWDDHQVLVVEVGG